MITVFPVPERVLYRKCLVFHLQFNLTFSTFEAGVTLQTAWWASPPDRQTLVWCCCLFLTDIHLLEVSCLYRLTQLSVMACGVRDLRWYKQRANERLKRWGRGAGLKETASEIIFLVWSATETFHWSFLWKRAIHQHINKNMEQIIIVFAYHGPPS